MILNALEIYDYDMPNKFNKQRNLDESKIFDNA